VTLVHVSDPRAIEPFLRRETALHLYELGDLDPFFWPYTRWFGWHPAQGELSALALLYTGSATPTLLALEGRDLASLARLLEQVRVHLPARFHAHLSPGLLPCLGSRWVAKHGGPHVKMLHREPGALAAVGVGDVEPLGRAACGELLEFYAQAYPGNWFDPRMLDTGQYFGIRRNGALACVAGVHVCSPRYRVAVIGNVATAPSWRKQGLARRVAARLCQSLYTSVDSIGLNVHAANRAAIACYRSLGFSEVAPYDEYSFDSGQRP